MKKEKGKNTQQHRGCVLVSLFFSFWIVLIYTRFIVVPGKRITSSTNPAPYSLHELGSYSDSDPDPKSLANDQNQTSATPLDKSKNKSDPCSGKYIFVYELHPKFNDEMVNDCERATSVWASKCKYISVNSGMGPPLEGMSSSGWYATNPYALDSIFFGRMKRYGCLTKDPSAAAAFFVPFYGGFDLARYIWGYNTSIRDAASLELFDWLTKRPEWELMGGRDHFMVAGRMASDFRRGTDEDSDWGNKLLSLPAAENMTILLVESSHWHSNDFAIPWPTYFHPSKDSDVLAWQAQVRNSDRNWLFSFAGAARPDNPKSIRSQLMEQCRNSSKCKLLECDRSESSECYSPLSVMRTFQSSHFCLQPPGDTLTRRSIFDTLIAGCVPVLFHPGSAYTQYTWHLPEDYASYSIFIPEDHIRAGNVSLEEELARISPDKVKALRENVVRMIPRIMYADPRGRLNTVRDAFDVAVEAVIDKVTRSRKDMVEGKVGEDKRWKYVLFDQGRKNKGARDWDRFFLGQ